MVIEQVHTFPQLIEKSAEKPVIQIVWRCYGFIITPNYDLKMKNTTNLDVGLVGFTLVIGIVEYDSNGIKAETVVCGFSVLECRSSSFRTLCYLAVESQHVLEGDRTVFSILYARHRGLVDATHTSRFTVVSFSLWLVLESVLITNLSAKFLRSCLPILSTVSLVCKKAKPWIPFKRYVLSMR
jgi:hypothetical protein